MSETLQSTVKLNNGVKMPRLGLGVYQSAPGHETREAVASAIELGYRHIDTAAFYGNEADVGAAVRGSGLPRESLFVTTKLWNADHGFDATLKAFEASATRLGLDYVDLYLIHWPVERKRLESWRALERLLEEGRCRAIGVSNYQIRHLQELKERSPIVPAANQVEFHPFLYQAELLSYCREQGIVLQAYSPLVRGKRLGYPIIVEVSRAHGKTPAQVLVRWALQHGTVPLPKSVKRERIAENAQVFDFALDDSEMKALDALDESYHVSWDPTDAP